MKTPTKHIRVTMPDGSHWDVPAELIARERARFFCDNHYKERGGEEYCREFDNWVAMTIDNDEILTEWASRNTDWADISDAAKLHRQPDETDYARGWVNGDKEVVLL